MNKVINNFNNFTRQTLPFLSKWGLYTVTILGASYALYHIYSYYLKKNLTDDQPKNLTDDQPKFLKIEHNKEFSLFKNNTEQLKLPHIKFSGVTIPSELVKKILGFLDVYSRIKFTQVCRATRLYELDSTVFLYPGPCLWATFIDEKLHAFFSTTGTVKIFSVDASEGLCKSSYEATDSNLEGKTLDPRAGFYLHNALPNWMVNSEDTVNRISQDIFKLKKEEAGFVRTKKYEYTYTPYSLKIGCDSHCWGMVYDTASNWCLKVEAHGNNSKCIAQQFKNNNSALPKNKLQLLMELVISLPSYILCYQIVSSHTLILGCKDGTINMYNLRNDGKHFKTYKMSESILDFAFLNGFLWVATTNRIFILNKKNFIETNSSLLSTTSQI